MKKNYSRLSVIIVIMLMIILNAAGCGSKNTKNFAQSENSAEYKMSNKEADLSKPKNNISYNENYDRGESGKKSIENKDDNITQSKVIVYKTIDLETLKFDEVKNKILQRVEVYGGYIQNSHVTGRGVNEKEYYNNRSANLVLRIPKDKLKDFENDVDKLDCSITNTNLSTEDVTMQYFDNEAHLKSLKIQEERLLELLKKSGELKDILEVERELQGVRYEIERLTGTLRKLDNLVDYSTITINIYEVHEIHEIEPKPVTLGQKIAKTFKTSVEYLVKFFKGIVIGVSAIIPFVLVFGVIGFVVYRVFKKIKNRDSNSENKK